MRGGGTAQAQPAITILYNSNNIYNMILFRRWCVYNIMVYTINMFVSWHEYAIYVYRYWWRILYYKIIIYSKTYVAVRASARKSGTRKKFSCHACGRNTRVKKRRMNLSINSLYIVSYYYPENRFLQKYVLYSIYIILYWFV